eukprot:m.65209 g.65209  ORF g.65209 m.65209 type:complete len:267 (+) comp11518_c0_seq6:469-1269(+)
MEKLVDEGFTARTTSTTTCASTVMSVPLRARTLFAEVLSDRRALSRDIKSIHKEKGEKEKKKMKMMSEDCETFPPSSSSSASTLASSLSSKHLSLSSSSCLPPLCTISKQEKWNEVSLNGEQPQHLSLPTFLQQQQSLRPAAMVENCDKSVSKNNDYKWEQKRYQPYTNNNASTPSMENTSDPNLTVFSTTQDTISNNNSYSSANYNPSNNTSGTAAQGVVEYLVQSLQSNPTQAVAMLLRLRNAGLLPTINDAIKNNINSPPNMK